MTWFSILERNSAQWENVFFDTVWNSSHFFPCSFSLQVQQPKLKIRCKTDCFPHNYNWTIFNWRYIHIFCLVTQSTTLGGTMLHAFRRFNQIDLQKSQKIPHLIKFWLLNVQENKKKISSLKCERMRVSEIISSMFWSLSWRHLYDVLNSNT